ncbi:MAG: DUF6339 family protein [Isosphaeraceae bacterium]
MTPLLGLLPSVRSLLDENFRSGATTTIDADRHVVDLQLGRKIDLSSLIAVVDEAIHRYRHNPDQSDQWLAPRVHATLRLSRREASDKRVWNYVNIITKSDYVRWRFGESDEDGNSVVPLDRFLGEDSKNALGRLWWIAELTRNGSSYFETADILKTSRFFVSWHPLDAMHHRPAALAVCRFVREFNDGKRMSNAQSKRLAKAFNLRLATLPLETISANPVVDTVAIKDWCAERIDETKFMDDLPIGPDEDPVPEGEIAAVIEVLSTLARDIDLVAFKEVRRRGDSQSEGDLVDSTRSSPPK